MSYPLENLFRRPVELASVAASLGGIVATAVASGSFGFSPTVTSTSMLCMAGLGAWRARQAYKLLEFQMNLRFLPKYEVTSADIKFSKEELFIGMGFWWGQEHTQRLYSARLPKNKHLKARNARYFWARRFEREHPKHWLCRYTKYPHKFNPVAPLPPVGGDPAIHGIEPDEGEMWTALAERVGHTLVLGTTRVGKTRLAELLITQDIHRGDTVVVFDPKGDVTLLQRMYAEAARAGRSKDFYFFHLAFPEISDRYSGISAIGGITEVATRVTNPLPGEGNSAPFKQFAWLYINVMSRAMLALGMTPTYNLIYQYAADFDSIAELYFRHWLDKDHPNWESDLGMVSSKEIEMIQKKTGRSAEVVALMLLIRAKQWNDPVANGLASVLSNDKTKYQALVNSLYPLLEKLTTGKISALLSPSWDDPHDKRRAFDWDKILDTGGIVYFGLNSLSDRDVAEAVGNAAFADLTSTAGRRYNFGSGYGQRTSVTATEARKLSLHADEFNELIGREFVPMVNKAGGAGYQVTAYTQVWADIEAKVGSAALAQQIGGNFNTLFMLRVKGIETAELLTNQLPKVEVSSTTQDSGATDVANPEDFTDFSSKSQDRLTTREVPMIQPSDLTSLPKGQAFALVEGGQLCKLRLPLPVKSENDVFWPEHMEAVFSYMHKQYDGYLQTLDGEALPTDFEGNVADELTLEGGGRGF